MKKRLKTCEIGIVPLRSEFCEPVYCVAAKSLPDHWSLQSVRDILLYDNNIFCVAIHKETNVVLGFAGILASVDEAELLNIAVLPEYRENGIGQRLLERMFAEAEKHGAGRILLEVRKSNHSARHLYRKNGFAPLAERKGYYSNPKEDAVIMQKRL